MIRYLTSRQDSDQSHTCGCDALARGDITPRYVSDVISPEMKQRTLVAKCKVTVRTFTGNMVM